MADTNYFPTDLTIKILLNLPKKSLERFKSVCESWRSLIEDNQFIKHHSYLNQILKAFKKERDCSIDDPIIDPPSVISHQLSIKFINSNINGVFLLAVQMPDRIVFWNPENLSESASISRWNPTTTWFFLGERIYFAKVWLRRYLATSWNGPDYLEVWKFGYSKTEELKEFANRITESKRKLEEFGDDDDDEPQVLLFIDRTYAEALISSNDDTLH
ncbi:hypothetical protein R3W88_025744 [Solanum pinnatisectum]|uniref:F-box domain-containing protein n=1 Tax=Solanum pinnatisectum TaxID=50273 RepID=A0AAV9M4A1_9SOLN|nr:hypothetical protein R3W88_025744 [Solanum pinnatisectum]